MTEQPTISVVIPVKNEAAGIAACLDGILSQTVPVKEILVIDSGSTDGTQEIVQGYDLARLLEIEPGDFNHGDTRNLGVRETNGELILFTVGDARPVDDRWIERLQAGFVAEDVAAVGGIQIVAHDPSNNPLEWYRPVSEPVRSVHRFGSAAEFDAADGAAKQSACVIDDVTSMYRRAFLEAVPFRRTVYGEDMLICVDALRAGHALVRDPAACVFHYHLQNYRTTLQRTVAVCLMRHDLFGTTPGVPVSQPAREAVRLMREPSLSLRQKVHWWRNQRQCFRGMMDGIALFEKARSEGAAALAALHEEYLGTPPIPVKRGQANAA
ncbi:MULTISPECIES: glycosyltransferase [unclassified Minwuia]|uniref:glycosyltransferase family 2 protein n=1 Tax=unclassified Minwuia TaxID=2618799 RepID=UPI002478CF23|nr:MULTISPECIES: glycosyltransferase [unclassified Minwuia]